VSPTHDIQFDRPIAGVRVLSGEAEGAGPKTRAAGGVPEEIERLRQAAGAALAAGEEFRRMRRELLAAAEEQLLDLAIRIARKVLYQEIHSGRMDIQPIVRHALSRVVGAGNAVVRLNPGDLARLVQATGGDKPGVGSEHVRFVADIGVGPGECLVEAAEGLVEATVEGQLAAAREAMGEAGEHRAVVPTAAKQEMVQEA